ncbi:hypothetical protein F5884DRAFT_503507 [Xylogone sp. PMI_703]|nr:hypothetical protein F5884DRAFT_503507 [Xylogone sp. PMI_703]
MATTEEKERWFKGHRQPEINERLDQINNFLADEDVYRCPDFDSKFEVIRDYLKYIFNEGFRYDVDKFSDAKAKCNIHVSTIGTGWEGLPPKSHIYAKNDKNSTICILRSLRETGKLQSNRLIAQEVGSTTRKKEILLRGMRSNHPPFKIDDDFADGFEEAFKADWYQDPKSIDDEEEYEDTNLVHLEGKAYIHALENPTAIPVLLHNLENAFLRDYYDDPWDLELNKNQTDDFELSDEFLNAGFTVGILRRLEKTEDLMNDILKKWPKVTRTQYEDFMQSVEPYAPSEIKALKEQILRLKTWGCRLGWAEFGRVEKWVNNNLANYYELQRSCRRKLNEWIKKLKINGVSLVPAVQDDQCVIILQPRAKPVVDSLSKGTVTTCQWPIPDESDSIDLGGVAEIRGTRRAAVELALNLFATNKEQHRPNQRFRRVELPKPRPQIPDEVPLCLPVEPEDREAEQDPFKFTKAMFHLRKSLQVEYSNAIKSEKGGADNAGWILPADYDGPLVILTGEELCDRIRKKIEPLKALLIKMAEAGGPYPRPFLQHIKLIVDQSMKATMDPTGDKEPLDSDEFRLLESLTEEQKPVAWDELETIGHHSSYCRPDFEWKLHIPWFKSVIDILETCGGVPLPHKGSPKLFQGSQEIC